MKEKTFKIYKTIKSKIHLSEQLEDPKNSQLPDPFCFNNKRFKAFVLGADPSNFSENKNTKLLITVFGIGSGDNRYFNGILKNLKIIGFNLEDIYVQNLIPFYMKGETGGNKYWDEIAQLCIPYLRDEFDLVDRSRKKPVLITAERILKVLLNNNQKLRKPGEYYRVSDKNCPYVPVEPEQNKLQRRLLPLYRHRRYDLDKGEWKMYAKLLHSFFD